MISSKKCPNCGSSEVAMVSHGKWICKKCNYSGMGFRDEAILGKEDKQHGNLGMRGKR